MALVRAVRAYILDRATPALFTEDPLERIAQCQCGQLRAVASGEPDAVNMCHCSECQRRTGAVFGSGAYYKTSSVRIEGPSKLYTRDGQGDRKVRIRFCPNCGSSVYWEADLRPGLYGIAVGAFADPRFPPALGLGLGAIDALLDRGSARSAALFTGTAERGFPLAVTGIGGRAQRRHPPRSPAVRL